jgi:hypothetical protein
MNNIDFFLFAKIKLIIKDLLEIDVIDAIGFTVQLSRVGRSQKNRTQKAIKNGE